MLTNECHECGNYIEFPDHGVGEQLNCPHCGVPVVLTATTVTERMEAVPDPAPGTVEQAMDPKKRSDLEELVQRLAKEKASQPHVPASDQVSPVKRPRTGKRNMILAIACLGAVGIIGGALIQWRLREHVSESNQEAAVEKLARDAALIGAPTNLFGAQWLMSMAEVMKAIPGARLLAPGVLGANRRIYNRDALVSYHFTNDLLLLVGVRFSDSSTPADYEHVQAQLSKEYGRMPEPVKQEPSGFSSLKKINHFAIEHSLLTVRGKPSERVLLYMRRTGDPKLMPQVPENKTDPPPP